MKKKLLIWAEVLAALVIMAVILVITALSPSDNEKMEVIFPQSTASPKAEMPQASIPISTPERTAEETPAPAKTQAGTKKDSSAFTLKIKNRTIPVAYGVDDATLKKSPGWLASSAIPGQDGMCVVYGHRNRTHLRVLENVRHGDSITITMNTGAAYAYTVSDIRIFENTSGLRLPAQDGKTLALITCYPFRYSGSAPGKIAITAKIKED